MELSERIKEKLSGYITPRGLNELLGAELNEVTQLTAERNAFILMYQMSVQPVDVPHEEVVEAHRIVKEFLKEGGEGR